MNLYRISQSENMGYDTYDSAVVVAEDAADARSIHPNGRDDWDPNDDSWCSDPSMVEVEYLGIAAYGWGRGVVVCSSFNAG